MCAVARTRGTACAGVSRVLRMAVCGNGIQGDSALRQRLALSSPSIIHTPEHTHTHTHTHTLPPGALSSPRLWLNSCKFRVCGLCLGVFFPRVSADACVCGSCCVFCVFVDISQEPSRSLEVDEVLRLPR